MLSILDIMLGIIMINAPAAKAHDIQFSLTKLSQSSCFTCL